MDRRYPRQGLYEYSTIVLIHKGFREKSQYFKVSNVGEKLEWTS